MQATNSRGDAMERDAGFADYVEQHFVTAYRFAFCLSLTHEIATELTEQAFSRARKSRGGNTTLEKRQLLSNLHQAWCDRDDRGFDNAANHQKL
ncbi:MAG: hypothetical protein H0X40_16870 [Chthoniobacterales bacterium]|nr:hypothetical protein [Chthoniobacterales bacterium]